MWNLRELVPTQRVSRGHCPALALDAHPERLDVTAVPVRRVDGSTGSVQDVLDDTFTDGFGVLQDGALVAEWHAPGGGPDRVHAVLSVTKSLVGCVAGILVDGGVIDEQRPVED